MLNTVISFFKSYQHKKKLKKLRVKIKLSYRELGEKSLNEWTEVVLGINPDILQINKEYLQLETDYFAKEDLVNENLKELKYYKNDFEERLIELKNKLQFSKRKLKSLQNDVVLNRKKLKLRLKKESEIQEKYKVLTVFQDKNLSKTITNLKAFILGSKEKRDELEELILKYKDKIERLNNEKIITCEKISDSLKDVRSEMKVLRKQIENCEKEREEMLINLGKKISKRTDLPEILISSQEEIDIMKENLLELERNSD